MHRGILFVVRDDGQISFITNELFGKKYKLVYDLKNYPLKIIYIRKSSGYITCYNHHQHITRLIGSNEWGINDGA